MTEGWPEVLDDLERHLSGAGRVSSTAERYAEVSAFAPPPDLPAAARSRWPPGRPQLLARAQELVEEGERLREETARRVTSRRRLAFFRQPTAAYVDRLA